MSRVLRRIESVRVATGLAARSPAGDAKRALVDLDRTRAAMCTHLDSAHEERIGAAREAPARAAAAEEPRRGAEQHDERGAALALRDYPERSAGPA